MNYFAEFLSQGRNSPNLTLNLSSVIGKMDYHIDQNSHVVLAVEAPSESSLSLPLPTPSSVAVISGRLDTVLGIATPGKLNSQTHQEGGGTKKMTQREHRYSGNCTASQRSSQICLGAGGGGGETLLLLMPLISIPGKSPIPSFSNSKPDQSIS